MSLHCQIQAERLEVLCLPLIESLGTKSQDPKHVLLRNENLELSSKDGSKFKARYVFSKRRRFLLPKRLTLQRE